MLSHIRELLKHEGSMKSAAKPMTPLRIRKAGMKDASAILACLAAAFEEYRDSYSAEAFADTVLDSETVQRRLSEMCVLLAMTQERVVGTISWSVHGAEGHLRGMAVFPDWRGTGVASALLRAAEQELLRSGCSYVKITAGRTWPLQNAFASSVEPVTIKSLIDICQLQRAQVIVGEMLFELHRLKMFLIQIRRSLAVGTTWIW
jgi:GNAT superfamily N-acetyltransferase